VASDPTAPGTLLIAPASEDPESPFHHAVVLVVEREPSGITSGLVLNRPSEQQALETSALALLFVPDPAATVFWGGPMGNDPAILAEFTSTDGLEWFHLPKQLPRPFPLPDVGVIAVAEHPTPFEGRIRRARLFTGLCVWGAGQLEKEVDQRTWLTVQATAEHIFTPRPSTLWAELSERRTV
jgi:putative transcriptional regulator